MMASARELVAVDRQQLDVRAGVVGVVVVGCFGAAVAVVGPVAMAAAVGALVTLSAQLPSATSARVLALLTPAVGGTVVTFLAVRLGEEAIIVALLAGVVAVGAAMHVGDGAHGAPGGLVATLWTIVAISLHGTRSAGSYAFAFALGAVLGAVTCAVRTPEASRGDGAALMGAAPRSPREPHAVSRFDVVRGVGIAVAVYLGSVWFPAHPAWVGITTLLVLRPPTQGAFVVGVQRSLGTALGVVVAVPVADIVGGNRLALVLLFLTSAFCMMAIREANYALFAVAVTTLVIYLQRLLGADVADSGRDRVLETLLGVVIAFLALALAAAVARDERRSD